MMLCSLYVHPDAYFHIFPVRYLVPSLKIALHLQ